MWDQITLCKWGGSLLDLPHLGERLESAFLDVPRPLLLMGGGAAADVVREWDQQHELSLEQSHQLAIDSLRLTASLICCLSSRCELADNPAAVEAIHASGQIPVIDPVGWLRELECTPATPLVHNWDTTSDSIGLWICGELQIPHLYLYKSVDNEFEADWNKAAVQGSIDAEFPRLWDKMKFRPEVTWVNQRAVSVPS